MVPIRFTMDPRQPKSGYILGSQESRERGGCPDSILQRGEGRAGGCSLIESEPGRGVFPDSIRKSVRTPLESLIVSGGIPF